MLHSHGNITATATQSVPSSNGWKVKNWETGTWDPPSCRSVTPRRIEEAIGWPSLVARGPTLLLGLRRRPTLRRRREGRLRLARIWIRPVAFAAWCKERNVSPDQGARLTFVNEATRITVMTFPNSR
jgi:hypothetical protein